MPGLGLATSVHAVPLKCSMRVSAVLPEWYWPTAHTSVGEAAATPRNWFWLARGDGASNGDAVAGASDHAVPL